MCCGAARARGGVGRAHRGARRGRAGQRPRRLRHAASRGSARPRSSPASSAIWTPDARVLLGTCDDLSIPRPLGPIRDLVGSVSAPLEEALSAGAAPHEIQRLLIAELELPPQPTVLVLEDVHWADDATLDSITVLGRRIGSLPALLVLTFRAGEVPPGHPLHAARRRDPGRRRGVPRARAAVGARGRLARRRRRGRGLRGDRRQPVLRHRAARLARRRRAAALGRERRAGPRRRGSTTPRGASWSSSPSCRAASRTSVLDAVMPDWAAAAEEPERRQLLEVDPAVRPLPARAGAERDQVEHPDRRAPPPPRRDPRRRCWPRTPIRPTSSTTPRPRARRTSSPSTRSSPRGARRRWGRTARRTRTTGAPSDFVDRLPAPSRRRVLEELATAAYVVGRARRRLLGDRARDRRLPASSATRRPSAAARASSRGSTGSRATATRRARTALEAIAILEPLGESVELARAYSGLSQLAMLAEDAEQALGVGGARARARDPARRREHARARARQHRQREDRQLDPAQAATLLEAHAIADAAGDRHEAARALDNLGVHADALGAAGGGAPLCASRRSPTPRSTRCITLASYLGHDRSRGCGCAPASGTRPSGCTRRELERGSAVSELLAKTVLAELAVRRGDAGRRRAAGRARGPGRSNRRAAADRRRSLELATEWALTPRRADAGRAVREARRAADRGRPSGRLRDRASPRGPRSPGRRRRRRRRRLGAARRDAAAATGAGRRTRSARSAGRTTAR